MIPFQFLPINTDVDGGRQVKTSKPKQKHDGVNQSARTSNGLLFLLGRRGRAALLFCLLAAHGCCARHKTHHAPPSHGGHYPQAIPPRPPPPAPVPATNASTSSNSSSASSSNGTNFDGGGWLDARATCHGAPNGAGTDNNGGACGFKNVNMPPFSAMTSYGNEPLFRDGKGCGSCYQVRVSGNHPACSGVPEMVIITDMNYYPVAHYHFDLSGTAFGAMSKDDCNDELRHAGIIDMQFRRVVCEYPGLTVTFHVQHRSNHYYMAIQVEYENGDGDVDQVDLMESRAEDSEPTGSWEPMRESWGSIWRFDMARPLRGPFLLCITNESGKTLVTNQFIPADWTPNTIYSSVIQYYD